MSNTSPQISAMGRLDVGGETTFGTEASNYDYLRSLVVEPSSLSVEAIRDEHMRAVDYETQRIIGAFSGTLTTTHYLHGWTSTLPTSAPTITDSTQAGANAFHHLAAILASALGNFVGGGHVGSATVGASGSPTDAVTVDDASGGLASFGAGQPVAWANPTSGGLPAYFVQWLTDIDASGDPDVGTLLQTTPPFDPQGSVVYGGHPTIWLPTTGQMDPYHNNASNSHSLSNPATSWSLKVLRHAADDVFKSYGCRPIGVKITFPVGKLPMLEITWGVAHWEEAGSGGTPAAGTWSFPEPEAVLGCWASWGDTCATSLPLKNLSVELGITRPALTDSSKASGVGGWFTSKRTPAVTFDVYRDHSEEVTRFLNQTGKPFTFQHGSQPGQMFALCIPNARCVEWPAPKDDEGSVMAGVKLEAHEYSGDTGTASEIVPINSPFRMAFL